MSKHLDGEWEGERRYKLHGVVHDCDCQVQYELRKRYLLANIPDQYQRLDFTKYRDEGVRQAVQNYLDKWDYAARLGIGLMFRSVIRGTGKTFAATYVGKQLIQRGQRVLYTSFREIIAARDAKPYQQVHALVIDEVQAGWSQASAGLFDNLFEEVVRHRNHFSQPTILTTNLTEAQFASEYPGCASLMLPTTIEVDMPGDSWRTDSYAMEHLALMANGEVRPLT